MTDPGEQRISEVTAELVARGIPKLDDDSNSSHPAWWVHHPEPSPDAPHICVIIIGSNDGKEWQIGVNSCPDSDGVDQTEMFNYDGNTVATLAFWPGLDAAIQFHQQANTLWMAEMERFLRREKGEPPQWRAS